MTKSRPLIVKDFAKNWPALDKWTDKSYLIDAIGNNTFIDTARLSKPFKSKVFSRYTSPILSKRIAFGDFINKIIIDPIEEDPTNDDNKKSNSVFGINFAKGSKPEITYAYDIPLTRKLSSTLKQDFEFGYLHKFLRLRQVSLSILPAFEMMP